MSRGLSILSFSLSISPRRTHSPLHDRIPPLSPFCRPKAGCERAHGGIASPVRGICQLLVSMEHLHSMYTCPAGVAHSACACESLLHIHVHSVWLGLVSSHSMPICNA
ncbi:hypothetical protein K437DRAFT_162033 [Tilletiaria anomala UBC 951]|uniref:Uncharacterized protein n=1 Tax=Tilletiaria anomala (strain ATCC 24038 / CBS 436.72 / UBC 951) TaxID=1037660 RepID=A0A066WJG8_TILAU|nr:uncharacterized protein K437DRAFT_162033 [Tilletiaria anomala UBC 951]KDN52703.1 hypothetical protein K437DRAFT_162033 [Tilletiaria anomala UBC 951]